MATSSSKEKEEEENSKIIFNHSLLQLFGDLIPKDYDFNITFGCRNVYNQVLILRYGSGQGREELIALKKCKQKPLSRHYESVSIFLFQVDKMGEFDPDFFDFINRHAPELSFCPMPHDSTEIDIVPPGRLRRANIYIMELTKNHKDFQNFITRDMVQTYGGIGLLRTFSIFNGKWKYFHPDLTRKRAFWVSKEERLMLPMMTNTKTQKIKVQKIQIKTLPQILQPNAVVYNIKYNNGTSLIICMRYDIATYKDLHDDMISFSIIGRFDRIFKDLTKKDDETCSGIMMPRFSHETSIDLSSEVLSGVVPFPGPIAIEDMFEGNWVVSQYEHTLCSRINVNEFGTSVECTFDTIIDPGEDEDHTSIEKPILTVKTAPDELRSSTFIRFNKPFCYFIVHDSGAIIHMGVFTGRDTPEEEEAGARGPRPPPYEEEEAGARGPPPPSYEQHYYHTAV